MVIADGAAAFARVHSDLRFNRSDLFAVVPRTSDPDQLETLVQQLGSLNQWYTPQSLPLQSVAGIPAGVAVTLLGKN